MIFCFSKVVLGIDPVACKVSSDDNIFLGICPVYPGKWYVDNVVPSLNKIYFFIKYVMSNFSSSSDFGKGACAIILSAILFMGL